MDSNTLCFAAVLLCAAVLLAFPAAVVPMPAGQLPSFPFRLLSRATGRYMVLREGQPVHAGGTDSDDSTVVCVTYKSLKPPVLVTIHSCQDPSLFLAIDSKTGHIQAKKMVPGEDFDAVITFELVIPEGFASIDQQLVASVAVTQPCPGDQVMEKGSGGGDDIVPTFAPEEEGEEPEPKLCPPPVTKQCNLAFDASTEQVIHCLDQDDLAPKDSSKTLSLNQPDMI